MKQSKTTETASRFFTLYFQLKLNNKCTRTIK